MSLNAQLAKSALPVLLSLLSPPLHQHAGSVPAGEMPEVGKRGRSEGRTGNRGGRGNKINHAVYNLFVQQVGLSIDSRVGLSFYFTIYGLRTIQVHPVS